MNVTLIVPKNLKILVATVLNITAAIQTRPVYRVCCERKKGSACDEVKGAQRPQRPEAGPCSSIDMLCNHEQITAAV